MEWNMHNILKKAIGDKAVRIEIAMVEKVLNNQNKKFKGLIISLILLNVLDGMFTLVSVNAGLATEINPLMDILISTHPVLFMFTKMLLVYLGALLLWRYRDNAIATVSLYLCCVTYSFVILYHTAGLFI